MKRSLLLVAVLLCAFGNWPATPSAQRGPTMSAGLRAPRSGDRVRVIVQGADPALGSLRGRLRGLLRRDLGTGLALDLTREEFDKVSRDSSLAHISADALVSADMSITNIVTAADSVWQGSGGGGLLGGLLGGTAGYDGSGIGVAVIDSGIASHTALGTRVIARANMVSWEPDVPGDAFGHGTHIAGAIAARQATGYGSGSAPGVRLVDVRVLGRNGTGLTSDVIAGIDWAVANRSRYGIRVISLALGHPVSEPSTIDPLCKAVERAVAAGVVVIAAAGNYGRTADGRPVLGGITSPGNSPAAITVGAVDTFGTPATSDDALAPYSSRGPTRFEFAVKPDVVAPGTRIVSLESSGSYLARTYPSWHIGGTGRSAYMRLSGTSMATAVVAGGAALLLDAYPGLTPAQVKVALQMGARYMPSEGLIGAGAGVVNFAASMRVAKTGLLPNLLATVESLLGTSSGASYRDRGTMIDRLYDRTGLRLLGLLDLGGLLGLPDGGEAGVLNLLGPSNPMANVQPNYLVWGTMADWTSSYYLVWGTSMQSPSGQYLVWGTADTGEDDYLVWGTTAAPDRDR